jgi:hypothetical protein
MFSEKDIQQFEAKGISLESAQWQINQFTKGIIPVNIVAPATVQLGITLLQDPIFYINKYKNSEVKITKFVPASGAASRMFKALFEFRDELKKNTIVDIEKETTLKEFFKNIKKFAFYGDLEKIFKEDGGVERVLAKKEYGIILEKLLDSDGLSYGNLPKGLLKFHFYAGNIGRTPFEEHLVEGARYAKSIDGMANLHFTVSPEHMDLFTQLKERVVNKYEDMYRVKYNISFSVQKESTDTIAVKPNNSLFYDSDGSILFRPGGHGALIENLNELDSDLIFIKNIDNLVPEKRLDATISVKQAIGGLLLDTQSKIFALCEKLESNPTQEIIDEAKKLIKDTLCLSEDCCNTNDLSEAEYLFNRLNRPLRVCGMVKNEGEPGGGPFLVEDKKGCISPQIVESSQIDLNNPEQANIFNAATHFNPVDLVCAVKDFKGNKFNLKEFIDNETCFISEKSQNGKTLKALELPGLWNGAMAYWNTIFVEVPVKTFNPVKTVNDLLRDAHQ